MVIRQELLHDRFGIDASSAEVTHFDAIASGEDQRFADALAMNQVGHRLRQMRFGDMHPLTDLDRGGAMIDANES